jgi:hypothetical protein
MAPLSSAEGPQAARNTIIKKMATLFRVFMGLLI